MKLKTGLFGGSFNPIHNGHLALANYLCEYGELDELWFMVSPHNPLKEQSDLLSDRKRLELAQLAAEGYRKFKVSDFEFHLPKPSYTVHTLDALRQAYPDREFVLIIGADNWNLFEQWKDYRRIIAENGVIVYPRSGTSVDETTLVESVSLVKTPLIEISSSFIRTAIKQGKDVRYFLHPSVWKEIIDHQYYIE